MSGIHPGRQTDGLPRSVPGAVARSGLLGGSPSTWRTPAEEPCSSRVSPYPAPNCLAYKTLAVRTTETGWSPSAQAAVAGGAGRGGSPAVLGAQLRGPGLGQTGPQGGNLCFLYSARLPGLQVPAVAGGGSGVWGWASGRCRGREGVEGVVLFTGWRGSEN